MNNDSKYTTPKLPTAQNILEDIKNESGEVKLNQQLKFTGGNSMLSNAYSCYSHMKQLKNDIAKQIALNEELEVLNKELVLNIENMKKQQ